MIQTKKSLGNNKKKVWKNKIRYFSHETFYPSNSLIVEKKFK